MENIEEAYKAIEQDKKQRAEDFSKALENLCKEYRCDLSVTYVQNNPNLPSVGQIQIIPL